MRELSEEAVRKSVAQMTPLDRGLYFDHLRAAKATLGIPEVQRSLTAANAALARVEQGRRWRRGNREAFGWPVLDGDEANT